VLRGYDAVPLDADLFREKCDVVYLHVFDSYWDDGRSIYSESTVAA
jgi:hypothetical protein